MKITIESTTKIVELNGVPARIWEGESSSGIKCHCFISRLAVDADDKEANAMFLKELHECKQPSEDVLRYPLYLII